MAIVRNQGQDYVFRNDEEVFVTPPIHDEEIRGRHDQATETLYVPCILHCDLPHTKSL
jgi:hypothetical protein